MIQSRLLYFDVMYARFLLLLLFCNKDGIKLIVFLKKFLNLRKFSAVRLVVKGVTGALIITLTGP